MEQANWFDELHALLREETTEGQNGWYQARDRHGQTAGYLGDVARALRLAQETFRTQQWPTAIGLQCRYVLITTSFNNIARNIPTPLLSALVKEEIWTPAKGLAYARQVANPARRVKVLAEITSCLPEAEHYELLQQALMAVEEITNKGTRAKALAELASHLPEALLPQVLAAPGRISTERARAEALQQQVLTAVEGIRNQEVRAETLVKVAAHLPEAERVDPLRQALAVVKAIRDERVRAEALARSAPYLPEMLLPQALALVEAIRGQVGTSEGTGRVGPAAGSIGVSRRGPGSRRRH